MNEFMHGVVPSFFKISTHFVSVIQLQMLKSGDKQRFKRSLIF
jgi:hypothetical protein